MISDCCTIGRNLSSGRLWPLHLIEWSDRITMPKTSKSRKAKKHEK